MLSTCNRTEVYAVAERFHGAYADIRDFFCELGGLGADELHPHLYSQHDEAAVTHLFEVAAGLDSAVLGESEILGQVRSAWELAQARGRRQGDAQPAVPPRPRDRQAGPHRDGDRSWHRVGQPCRGRDGHRAPRVARRPPRAGRRRRRDGRGHRRRAGARRRRRHHRRQPHARARRRSSPQRIGGRVVPFAELPAALADADVLLTCTGAGGTVIDLDLRRRGSRRRRPSPLLIVDIAVPRDVGRRGRQRCRSVTLLDLDDLRDWAGRALALRADEADRVDEIVVRGGRALRPRGDGPPGGAARRPAARARRGDPSAPSSSGSPARLASLDDAAARRGRGGHQGHRRQAAARAVGAAQGRRRHARRASATPPPSATCSTSAEPMHGDRPLRLATRGSAQARTQAQAVADALDGGAPGLLGRAGVRRDARRPHAAADVPLHTIGGQGVFVKEVQQAVLDGDADIAVHSAKDLPSTTADGLALAAFCERRDARDALVGAALDELRHRAPRSPPGRCAAGPSSPVARPDLDFVELRGNIHTRLGKVPDGWSDRDGGGRARDPRPDRPRSPSTSRRHVRAQPRAGLRRRRVPSRRSTTMIERARARSIIGPAGDAVEVERAFLAELGSGCSLPVGAHATDGQLTAFLAAADRTRHLHRDDRAARPITTLRIGRGAALARSMRDRLQ